MKQNPRDWLLARDKDALPRLDSIGRAVLAPERATFREAVVEIFRPNLPVWASLAVVWLLLAAAHFTISPQIRPSSMGPGYQADMVTQLVSPDEALSPLDHHS